MPTVKGGCKFSVGSWYKNLDPVITGLRDKEHATGWLTPVGSQVIFYVASVYFSCVRSGLPRGVGWPPRHFQRRARPKAKGTSQSLFSGMEQPGASLKRQVLSLQDSSPGLILAEGGEEADTALQTPWRKRTQTEGWCGLAP